MENNRRIVHRCFCVSAVKSLPLFALLLLTGCATSKPSIPLTGDIMVDGPAMIAEGPAKDKVLWQYRTAAAAMRQAKFDEAKPLLDDALLTLRGIYGSDAEARKARGYFSKEARKTFIGEPYERSMAYFYRGVIYWRDGELDNARACFRSAEFEDSDAEQAEYKGECERAVYHGIRGGPDEGGRRRVWRTVAFQHAAHGVGCGAHQD